MKFRKDERKDDLDVVSNMSKPRIAYHVIILGLLHHSISNGYHLQEYILEARLRVLSNFNIGFIQK